MTWALSSFVFTLLLKFIGVDGSAVKQLEQNTPGSLVQDYTGAREVFLTGLHKLEKVVTRLTHNLSNDRITSFTLSVRSKRESFALLVASARYLFNNL